MSKFKDIPENVLKEIAALAFNSNDWITSEIDVSYQPYRPEWYEDADEFFLMKFTGYFAGEKTAEYKVYLRPTLNVSLFYSYKEETNIPLCVSNQNKIQNILNQFKESDSMF